MHKRHYIIPVFIPHLGCPHQCIFCNQREITGSVKELEETQVRKKIDEYLATIPSHNSIIEVAFYGGSFTGIHAELQRKYLAVVKAYLDRGLIQGIRLSTRPDYIDPEVITRLKEYDVATVELGVQSMDPQVLEAAHRGHSPAQVKEAVALLKAADIRVGLQMMVGLPMDTSKRALDSARQLIALQPEFVRIYPVLVIKGTPLAKLYQQGDYRPWTVADAVQVCKELLGLFRKAHIPVIRMGLQPTEEINADAQVLAGPFHPAFGELVESALVRDRLEEQCLEMQIPLVGSSLEIHISPRDESIVRGQKNCNVKWIKDQYQLRDLSIKVDPQRPRGQFQVQLRTDDPKC